MKDWDDLRFFLSVAEHGSTLAAGAALKTSQSTVFRRIGVLEDALGMAVFERGKTGYVLTPAGVALLPLAREVERAVAAFDQIAAREARQELEVIRFSAPDAALEYMLSPVMAQFRERYPDVRLEIIASPRQLDLASGEADVALRANPASDADLFGQRLVEERPAFAASLEYAKLHPLPSNEAELAGHDFIALTGVLATMLCGWFARAVPPERVTLQPDSIPSTLAAAKSGLGLAVLLQFIIDREPMLIAAPIALPVPAFDLWILTHQRLRRSPPIRALMNLVAGYVLATTPKQHGEREHVLPGPDDK